MSRRGGEDLRVDAHDFTLHVEERTAGVARIDRHVGLNEGDVLVRGEVARQSGHDARGHRVVEAEGGCRWRPPTRRPQVVRAADLSTGRSFASIFTTAMSVCLSVPRTLPLNSRLSVRRTMISSASSTTWAFVMMRPSAEMMKPEPVPRCSGISCWPPNGMGKPKWRKISA